jgi:hypothetical protein
MAIHKPYWFSDKTLMVSTAPTCGLTKGGRTLPKVDPATGWRRQVTDPETGELVDAVDDALLDDMLALEAGDTTDTLRLIPAANVNLRLAVPVYYDRRYEDQFETALRDDPAFEGFTSMTVAEMIKKGLLTIRGGHGSPSQEQRVGDVPYIKVSDLRAGTVNINPTNRVPRAVAQVQFWKGASSGLLPFDLVSPERTSKNIGDFCVLMPGQEQVVVTREVIILRPGPAAKFDAFYLLWAFSLNIVREQWKRVVFMQTNREDVGKRYYEIRVPIPPTTVDAARVSAAFRLYYTTMAKAREDFTSYLDQSGRHHFFVSGVEEQALPDETAIAEEEAMAASGLQTSGDEV